MVVGRGQDATFRVVGIRSEQESTASGANNANAATAALERIAGHRLVEVTNGDDGNAGGSSETFQGIERLAHSLVRIHVVPRRQKRDQGIGEGARRTRIPSRTRKSLRIPTGTPAERKVEKAMKCRGSPPAASIRWRMVS